MSHEDGHENAALPRAPVEEPMRVLSCGSLGVGSEAGGRGSEESGGSERAVLPRPAPTSAPTLSGASLRLTTRNTR